MSKKEVIKWVKDPKNHARLSKIVAKEMNRSYNSIATKEEKLISKHFVADDSEWLSSAECVDLLNKYYTVKLSVFIIGKELSKMNFHRRMINGINKYRVKFISGKTD